VSAPVAAREEAGAADGQHHAGTPAADQDAVHVDGVVVHVLAVAHVVPRRAAMLTRAHVERREVQRALYHVAVELPLRQRRLAMAAHIAQPSSDVG